jgi:hypothetical protein
LRELRQASPPQYYASCTSLSLSAILVSSLSDRAFILREELLRWIFTVDSLMPKSAAICLLSRPRTTWTIISRSRGLRVSKRARRSPNAVSFLRRARSLSRPSCIAGGSGSQQNAPLSPAESRRACPRFGTNDRPLCCTLRPVLAEYFQVPAGCANEIFQLCGCEAHRVFGCWCHLDPATWGAWGSCSASSEAPAYSGCRGMGMYAGAVNGFPG